MDVLICLKAMVARTVVCMVNNNKTVSQTNAELYPKSRAAVASGSQPGVDDLFDFPRVILEISKLLSHSLYSSTFTPAVRYYDHSTPVTFTGHCFLSHMIGPKPPCLCIAVREARSEAVKSRKSDCPRQGKGTSSSRPLRIQMIVMQMHRACSLQRGRMTSPQWQFGTWDACLSRALGRPGINTACSPADVGPTAIDQTIPAILLPLRPLFSAQYTVLFG